MQTFADELCAQLGVEAAVKSAGVRGSGLEGKRQSSLGSGRTSTPRHKPGVVWETVTTRAGASYRVPHDDTSMTSAPTTSAADVVPTPALTPSPPSTSADLLARILSALPPPQRDDQRSPTMAARVAWLEHLDVVAAAAAAEATVMRDDRVAEVTAALGLCMQLHGPRAVRLEHDVANVRAAEFVLHTDRIQRHGRALLAALHDQRVAFTALCEVQRLETARCACVCVPVCVCTCFYRRWDISMDEKDDLKRAKNAPNTL